MRKRFKGAPKTVEAGLTRSNLQRALFAVTIFIVMCILGFIAASCGKSSKGVVSRVNDVDSAVNGARSSNPDGNSQSGAGSPVDRVTMSVEGPLGGEFVFEPLDGDGTPDKKGEEAYELKLADGGGDGGSGGGEGFGEAKKIELTITAKEGYDWKYVVGYLHYDAEKYNPIEFKPGDLFGDDEKEVANVAIFKEKGRIAFWCGLLNFDKKDAKPGGDIGTFVIELAPWEPPRGPSTPPDDPSDKVIYFDEIIWDELWGEMDRFLAWGEVNRGDGDLSGEVAIADLTPLARYHGYYIWNHPMLDQVDYDRDGYIYYFWDYSVVGQNLQEQIDGYKILFRDLDAQEILYSYQMSGLSSLDRRARFNAERENLQPENPVGYYPGGYPSGFYWTQDGAVGYCLSIYEAYIHMDIPGGLYFVSLVPFDFDESTQTFLYGIESDPKVMSFLGQVASPTAVLHGSPLEGYLPLTVSFDASDSFDTLPGEVVRYSFDFDGDRQYEILDGSDPTVEHTYEVPGNYTARLRVKDDDDNYSLNIDTLPVTVKKGDWMYMRCWRYNSLDPPPNLDRALWGNSVLQYCDSNGNPHDGIVVRVNFCNIINVLKQLNAVTIYLDVVEAEGQPDIYFNNLFSNVYIMPYDGNLHPTNDQGESTSFLIWRYDDEGYEWFHEPFLPEPLRLEGYFSPRDKLYEPSRFDLGDNYADVWFSFPNLFGPQLPDGTTYKELNFSYLGTTSNIRPCLRMTCGLLTSSFATTFKSLQACKR